MLQVVGSSRISNTVYVAIASIYWTWLLTILGITLQLDVQTAVLVVSPSTAIAAFLWLVRIEDRLVTWLLIKGLLWSVNGRSIRYYMGRMILFLKPWQSSSFVEDPIEGELKMETIRVLKGPLLKEDLNELFQLFWLVIGTLPLAFLFLPLIQMPIELAPTIFVIMSLFFIVLMMERKRDRPARVLHLAFCSWLLETITTDVRRRERFDYYRQLTKRYQPEFRRTILAWTQELTQLANSGDWYGFVKNSSNFLNLLEHHNHEQKVEHEIDNLIGDLLWYYREEATLGPAPIGVTLSVRRAVPSDVLSSARTQVLDAWTEINSWYNLGDKSNRIWWDDLGGFMKRWDSLNSWESIYTILTEETIKMVSLKNIQELAGLPFFVNRPSERLVPKQCEFRGNSPRLWPIDLAICLMKAEEAKLIDTQLVFKSVSEWNVIPKTYVHVCSQRIKKLILEEHVGLPAIALKHVFRDILKTTSNLDSEKIASNLSKYESTSEFDEITKFLKIDAKSTKRHVEETATGILKELGLDNSED